MRDVHRISPDRIRETRAFPDTFPRLPGCDVPQRELTFRVGIHDLDLNDHVNHVVYVRWALEAAPEEVLRSFYPVEIEVSYRAEAFLADEILSRTQRAGATSGTPESRLVHGLFEKATGRELTRLRTRWAADSQ